MRTATLSSCELRLATPVAAADRVHDTRRSLFMEVRDGVDVGVGECATSGLPGVDPTADEVTTALDALVAEGALESTPTDAEALLAAPAEHRTPATRAAFALLQGACLDLALRREGRSLAHAIGVVAGSVPYAGVVGVAAPGVAAATARALVATGAARLRVKHAPGRGVGAIAAVLGAVGSVPVAVDANGAMDPARDRAELDAIAALPIAWLEQPFDPGDLEAHAALARRGVRVGLDESVTTRESVRAVARLGAASVLCVKPSRVGGVGPDREGRGDAVAHGIATYVGGAFEAGLGRATLGALAAADTAAPAGDVVGPAAYLVEDPCALAPPREGRQPLHTAPGCGPHPTPTLLEPLRRYGH